ncbi:MAG TPA: DUF6271 family protein [Streptosporangiaceae bacterium]
MPSDRPGEDSIADAIEETRLLDGTTGEDYAFALIEHGREHEEAHAELLRKLAGGQGARYLHLTTDRWDAVLATALGSCSFTAPVRERVRRLLSPEAVSYSGGPNKCALLAAALGVTVVHRRDSDQVADIRDGEKAFPGVLEAAAIGKAITDLPKSSAPTEGGSAAHASIRFVGSSIFGDSGHDRRDLLASGEEHLIALERLSRPGLTLSELTAAAHRKFAVDPALRHEGDFWDSNDPGRVSVGVACVKDMFYELPEMPMENMLGSDYYNKSIAGALGYPVVYHSRKMRHTYDPVRAGNTDLPTVTSYALRDLRNVMFLPVRAGLCGAVAERPDHFTDDAGHLRQDRLADQLEGVYGQHAAGMREVPRRYSEIYATAAAKAPTALATRLRAVAEASARSSETVLEELRKGVEDYSLLIRAWKELIANAGAKGSRLPQLSHT